MISRRMTYNDSYREMIGMAKRFAIADNSGFLRVRDFFNAALTLHGDYLRRIIGKNDVVFPEITPPASERKAKRRAVVFGTNTDRYLSLYGGVMTEIVEHFGKDAPVDAFHVCAAFLLRPSGVFKQVLDFNGIESGTPGWTRRVLDVTADFTDKMLREETRRAFSRNLVFLREARDRTLSKCIGQKSAVNEVFARITAFNGQIPRDRDRRPLVFCFIGESGTGKTTLAESVRMEIANMNAEEIPPTIDLSRYANEQLGIDLVGRDPSWKDGGKKGDLTEAARKHPNGVIILDNFDTAHPNALNHVVSAMSDGKLTDGYTKESVSFEKNIFILTTTRGAEFLGTAKFTKIAKANGGNVPKEKLVEGLLAGFKNKGLTIEGSVGGVIKKSDCPILFSRHTYDSIRKILLKSLDKALSRTEKTFKAKTDIDRERFADFLVETVQNFASAHGIAQGVENVISTALQSHCLDNGYDVDACREIRYEIDDLPSLETTGGVFDTFRPETAKERTAARLASAKRLEYATSVRFAEETYTVRIGSFSYATMPAIEDADWFSVRPPDMTWKDLVGLETPRRHVERVLKHFRGEGGEKLVPETGILLWGPPGTGKTSFAKAVASELNAPFIAVCGADFQATHNDNRAIERIHTLFTVARRNKAVVFIDEIDAIGDRDTSTGAQASVINAFLSELDGIDETKVLVIGATNKAERLDRALTRPGRLHHLVKIDRLKKADDRRKLVKLLAAKADVKIPAALLGFIVETTENWSPAEIQAVLRETFHNADGSTPKREHFVTARLKEFEGDGTQHCDLSEEEKRHVAIHEAGHALLADRHGKKWIQVSLHGGLNALGFLELTPMSPTGKSARDLEALIDISLGGYAAETVVGEACEGSEADFRKASDYASRLLHVGLDGASDIATPPDDIRKDSEWIRMRPKINAILKKRLLATTEYLRKNKRLLEATADKLMENGTLFSDELPKADCRKKVSHRQERSRS